MPQPCIVILASAGGDWRIGMGSRAASSILEVEAGPEADAQQIAASVRRQLDAHGYGGQGAILAMPSEWCLAASFANPPMPKGNRRQILLYRFEDCLPLSAEDIVADFIVGGTETLGVCTETARASGLVRALEAQGIAVQHLVPKALLALQHKTSGHAALGWDYCLFGSGDMAELFVLVGGKPKAWYLLPMDLSGLLQHLGPHVLQSPSRVRLAASDVDTQILAGLSHELGLEIVHADDQPLDLAAMQMADDLLGGRTAAWADLRRDALAVADPYRQIRTPLACTVISLILLLACLSFGMLWRARHYNQIAADHEAQQHRIYHGTFPGQPLPPSARLRLLSEQRKLGGLSGEGVSAPLQQSSLLVLYEAMRRLPAQVRFRVLDVRVSDGNIYLDGQARSHGDADAVAAALRQGQAFHVEPPRTEQTGSNIIGFSLVATTPGEEKGGRR